MITADSAILKGNLDALRGKNLRLARKLETVEPDPSLQAEKARDGTPVLIVMSGKKPYFLHSRFDPLKEAERLAAEHPEDGYYLCPGLGCAYHMKELLKRSGTSGVLAIEPSVPMLRATLERLDLRAFLSDERVNVVTGMDGEESAEILSASYLPVLSGGLRSLPLRSRVDLEPERFKSAIASIASAVDRIAWDFTVQSVFGKRWFSNAVLNLERAAGGLASLTGSDLVLVAAAGPSLEAQASAIRAAKAEGGLLVSTDTALPFLLASSILPDAVLSIDCQHISYRHFLAGLPRGVPLLMELSSPATLSRISSDTLFFTTANPLGRCLSGRLRSLPVLDASGGNVTHAALSLAEALGAREVRLYGADYSYPRGKSYARGTHLYSSFASSSSRLGPVESKMAEILYRSPALEREDAGGWARYRNPVLDSYKRSAEAFASRMRARLRPEPGEGQEIRIAERRAGAEREPDAPACVVEAGAPRSGAREALASFRDEIEALKVPGEPLLPAIRALPRKQAELWLALLPVAAAVTRDSGATRPRDSLSRARGWALDRLGAYLQANPPENP